MKTTMEYTVGNTAIQIINTGKKIKVIDVKKEQRKRKIAKRAGITLATVFFIVWSCFYIVNMQNAQTMLDKEIYSLQAEIERMEHENNVLSKEYESQAMDYNDIYVKAKSLGMCFPKPSQLERYTVQKSTAIRMSQAIKQD